jgi:putative hydrolase of the HAD superfamily
MKTAILFDLGGTLAEYYDRSQNPLVLAEAMTEVQGFLSENDLLTVAPEIVQQRLQEENHEAEDYRVRPLAGRLARIFGLDSLQPSGDLALEMCRRFLRPIFARGRCYEDTLPALRELRSRGVKTAIVSNTPWGSPASPWREELARLRLDDLVDAAVFCADVGWRKPARQIFDFARETLHTSPQESLFVGDHPLWDIAGARGAGIDAVLIDRYGKAQDTEEEPIRDLHQLWDRL